MTDKPIIFNGAMVRAILDGRKTMTRRVLKPQPKTNCALVGLYAPGLTAVFEDISFNALPDHKVRIPFTPGTRLWVRETHFAFGHWITTDILTKTGKPKRKFIRRRDSIVVFEKPSCGIDPPNVDDVMGWYRRPSIFLERDDSRLTLTVTDVRVQRVQEISSADIRAEGCITEEWDRLLESVPVGTPHENERDVFRSLWDSINEKRGFGWEANPWVACYSFEVGNHNIDAQNAQRRGTK